MASLNNATEASPLLGTGVGGAGSKQNDRPRCGDQADRTADPSVAVDGDNVSGSDLERHSSVGKSRAAQFEGNPEIRAQLKYILPAMSIGV
jgi:hypothetical protein